MSEDKKEQASGKRLIVRIEKDEPPQVTISGDDWTATDIRAVKRMVDRAYRRWQRKERRKVLNKFNKKKGSE